MSEYWGKIIKCESVNCSKCFYENNENVLCELKNDNNYFNGVIAASKETKSVFGKSKIDIFSEIINQLNKQL